MSDILKFALSIFGLILGFFLIIPWVAAGMHYYFEWVAFLTR